MSMRSRMRLHPLRSDDFHALDINTTHASDESSNPCTDFDTVLSDSEVLHLSDDNHRDCGNAYYASDPIHNDCRSLLLHSTIYSLC
jgi:hypothetical protein